MTSNMAREWFNPEDFNWEQLDGVFPSALLDTHVSSKFTAMQVGPSGNFTNEHSAIWDTKTGRIRWNPRNANAICWIEGGNEILVLEESPKEGAVQPPLFVTPTQGKYQHFIRRLSWPELDTICRLELKFPMGWLIDIIPSPTDKLACFVWQDQCEAGVEFVSWEKSKLCQLPNVGLYEKSNLIRGPVFSPDGTVIAMTFGAGIWWADTPDEFSKGGVYNVGTVVWSETRSGRYARINVQVELPKGWKPNNPHDTLKNEFLSLPEFITSKEIKIMLPTGEERFVCL